MISSLDAGMRLSVPVLVLHHHDVQGRKSRYRSADDIEALARVNSANGVRYFFITDEAGPQSQLGVTFDRLIALRQEGVYSRFIIQVDTARQTLLVSSRRGGGGRQVGVHRA